MNTLSFCHFSLLRCLRAIGAGLALLLIGISVHAQVPVFYGYDVNGNRLVTFRADSPGTLLSDIPLTGLASGEFLMGIDIRPATGELYGIATNGIADSPARMVLINAATGVLSQPPGATTFPTPASRSVVFGVSFNPVADRIRVVSDAGANIRVSPVNGALTGIDTTLAYVSGDPNAAIVPSVVHIAYTNSFAGATLTTVYAIDSAANALVRIGGVNGTPSPNTGQMTTIGSLGVDANPFGAFDIDPRTNVGYAALRITGVSVLHSINLATGAATPIGQIGGAGRTIDGLAIVPRPMTANDLSGDGLADLAFLNIATGQVSTLLFGVSTPVPQTVLPPGSGWSLTHLADFDGDGKADMLVKNTDGRIAVLLMDASGAAKSFGQIVAAGTGYLPVATGDFNGDNKADVVIRNADGSTVILLINGTGAVAASLLLGPASPWSVTHIGDFNGDGRADIIIRNTDGSTAILLMNSTTVTAASFVLLAGSPWQVTHIGDFNGDGRSDILIRNSDGSAARLMMNGTTVAAAAFLLSVASPWIVTHVGDFNGDGIDDVIIRKADGNTVILMLNGSSVITTNTLLLAGSTSTVAQVADYNGDGIDDILLRANDGSVTALRMGGGAVVAAAAVWGAGTLMAVP
jgi:hypothetical protein